MSKKVNSKLLEDYESQKEKKINEDIRTKKLKPLMLKVVAFPFLNEEPKDSDELSNKHIDQLCKNKNSKLKVRVEHGGYYENIGMGKALKLWKEKEDSECFGNLIVYDKETIEKVKRGELKGVSLAAVNYKPENSKKQKIFYEITLTSEPYYPECKILEFHEVDFEGKSYYFLIIYV